jgi:coronin-7
VYYQSKYKYIDGKSAPKPEAITNLRNLSTMWPSECNGFQVNPKYAAYLLAGSSGQLGVVSLARPGRLPDTNIASLVNRSKISDFQFDPFDENAVAVGCDDGTVKIWNIPEDGLTECLEQPRLELRGHQERLYCIKYHPYVRDVLATASYDRTVRIWNVETGRAERVLKGHTDAVFGMSWSPCGQKLATICKGSN